MKRLALRVQCEPAQLGQGTSAGTQAHGFIARIHMQLYPTHICVKVDFCNAFSTIERARMVEAFANDTELNDVHRYMESHLHPRSRGGPHCIEPWREISVVDMIRKVPPVPRELDSVRYRPSRHGRV